MDTSEIKITIRPLRKSDVDGALNLSKELITAEEMASLNLRDPEALCFVAEAEGKLVGFNLASELYVGIPLCKICVIQAIVVHDDYRRLGIGERLVEEILNHCTECGIEAVRTLVDETDIRLRRFVEHLGFRRSAVANYDRAFEISR